MLHAACTNPVVQRCVQIGHYEVAAGYIRAIVPYSAGVSTLALTGAGLRRLEAGK